MATQLLLTRWLLPRKGPGFVIMVWALASVAALMVVVFSPDPHAPVLAGMPAVAIALIVSRGLAYGMAEPARHSLYTRMPRSVKSEEHTSALQPLMRSSYAVFCLKQNKY